VELYLHYPNKPSWRGAESKAQGQLYLDLLPYRITRAEMQGARKTINFTVNLIKYYGALKLKHTAYESEPAQKNMNYHIYILLLFLPLILWEFLYFHMLPNYVPHNCRPSESHSSNYFLPLLHQLLPITLFLDTCFTFFNGVMV
jgi:hypothetical protein